jgi:two-component system cell cycle response regulator
VKKEQIDHSYPVLLAEDNPVSRKILEKTLQKAGYEFNSVENGREALDLFNGSFFPIVLTDWLMPEMNGIELCRAIRENNNFSGYVYIIVLTGKDAKDDIVVGLEAGADDYLTKPFDQAELIARLNTAVRILELERSLLTANEKIRLLSVTDPLTGSYNRSYLNDRYPQEIQRAKRFKNPLSLVLCDIDHFKNVNDTYGHLTGDQVLKEVVGSITESLREKVDWVVRYGGEEFLMVLPETGVDGARIVAERVRSAISEMSIKTKENTVHITASFGVTGCDFNATDEKIIMEDMINAADGYLYQSKREGRNRVTVGAVTRLIDL